MIMSVIGIAYKGKGHLVRVYSDSVPRVLVVEKDTLSVNSLIKYLRKVPDDTNVVIPISRRRLPDGYAPINQRYYEVNLQAGLKEHGYTFLPSDPKLLEMEESIRKREKRHERARKRREFRHNRRQ